jgi:hypothetical protein
MVRILMRRKVKQDQALLYCYPRSSVSSQDDAANRWLIGWLF